MNTSKDGIIDLLSLVDNQIATVNKCHSMGVDFGEVTGPLQEKVLRLIVAMVVGDWVGRDRAHPLYVKSREIAYEVDAWVERDRAQPYISEELDGAKSKPMHNCVDFVNWLFDLIRQYDSSPKID